ncbi:hypothetical protein [Pseudoroseicyclus sp. CXY001]|uniref:hypothetical protein n=1 Tax=Pseudoroseicyclus sp. CXY001 TaxID=3242492 RepID=UPI0035712E2B
MYDLILRGLPARLKTDAWWLTPPQDFPAGAAGASLPAISPDRSQTDRPQMDPRT